VRRSAAAGFQLVELVVATALFGIAALVAAPAVSRFATGLELRLAADELTAVCREARAFAIRHADKVAVKFRTAEDGTVSWGLYRDGDGDGVRTEDIEDGVDPLAAPVRTLEHFGRRVRFGFPPGRAPRDPGSPRRRLTGLDDPIRFNRSDLASFAPVDGSTPGSLYLTDGVHGLIVVRVDPRVGRVHVLRWDARRDRWE
jgi:hypothetical protein